MTSGNIFMVCVDGSDAAIWAVKTAGRLAAAKEDSTLHLVHVVPFFDVPEGYAEKAKAFLASAKEVLKQVASKIETHVVSSGKDARAELCNWAESLHADFVVMGSEGLGGLKRATLGSVSDYVVRHCSCPVLITRADRKATGLSHCIWLVALDGSDQADLALKNVGRLLHPRDEVKVLRVTSKHAEELQAKLKEQTKTVLGEKVNVDVYVEKGDAREVILAQAKFLGADYIALGSRGLGGLKRMILGSVSDYVAQHAECGVLVTRGSNSSK